MYLGTIITGLCAELVARGRLIVSGDTADTATSILANQGLFRAGLVADLVVGLRDQRRVASSPLTVSGLAWGEARPSRESTNGSHRHSIRLSP